MAERSKPRSDISAVPIVDLSVGGKLPFDVQTHLKLNDKFVLVAKAGEPWSENKVKKMRELNLAALVPVEELPKYYSYAADTLRRTAEEKADPAKAERLRTMAGEIYRSLLDELYRQQRPNPEGEQTHARKILDLMIAEPASGWTARLLAARSDDSAFSHAAMTAYGAACLALYGGEPIWRSVVFAGFFHDLGRDPATEVTDAGAGESADKLAALEAETPAEVLEMIRTHASTDWFGVTVGARILATASRFDQLTRVQANQVPLSPDQALRQMSRENRTDPELIQRMANLFRVKI